MKDLSYTGGARVGMMNASFPLAKLFVEDGALNLNVLLLGKHRFLQSQITALQHVTNAVGLGKGIKIEHTHPTYSNELIFWTLSDPDKILDEIANSRLGLTQNVIRKEKVAASIGGLLSDANPLKVSFLIAIALLSLLAFAPFIISAFTTGTPDFQQFIYRGVAVQAILVGGLLGAIYSPTIREYVLKEDAEITRHKRGLLTFVYLTLFAMFLLLFVGGMTSKLIETLPPQ
ncbi:hypothetical protein [Lewinella sp. 4G2]|uniref:hypothetical protein n=1 Tax=Lewinella sp. 4G2 TaxID=1803372 RepID=UPI0007B4F2EF|nr:hypothetical protein [Lewinella sp. 4G2]OAV45358.1 hypothetical protein A3850_013035 [Lewinella sp. 4G2]